MIGIFRLSMTQPDLFAPDPLPSPPPEIIALARAIPPHIRFGTSTWTYDGWFGDVYQRHYRGPQPAKRLEEYARYPLFRTVGIDSAFYDPPSEEELQSYARALPAGLPLRRGATKSRVAHRSPRRGAQAARRRACVQLLDGNAVDRRAARLGVDVSGELYDCACTPEAGPALCGRSEAVSAVRSCSG